MLVLSRHRNESIVIDLRQYGLGTIEILTVDIRGDKVRTGIEARKDLPVHRREVFEAIERQTTNPAA